MLRDQKRVPKHRATRTCQESELIAVAEGIGDRFQQETKYHPGRMAGGRLDRAARPEPYKQYPGAKLIELPPPSAPDAPLDDALRKRQSIRDYSDKPITTDQLSYLLWASTGMAGGSKVTNSGRLRPRARYTR